MSAIVIESLLIILLLLINGVLAMAEMAIVSARKVRLQQRAEKGDAGARVALELANAPSRFLSTVQIGITLVGIFAGAFGGATIAAKLDARLEQIPGLAPYSEAIALGAVVAAVTYLSLIIGELVPKRLALNNPEGIAAKIARPMRRLSVIASPVVRLLGISTESVLRLLGARKNTEPPVTEEEIKLMIKQGAEAGVFDEAEQDMVTNIFRLSDRRAGALMTPRYEIVWIDIKDSPAEIERRFNEHRHSRFPVCDGSIDHVLGIVRAKDLLACCLAGEAIDLQAALRMPLFVPENMPALKALEMFKQTGTHLAIVLDEHGGMQGLVTHHDLMEAIVGDIPSAGLPTESPAVRREDGSWLLDGALPVDKFQQILGLKQMPDDEHGDYQTLAGFVLQQIGRIPVAGEQFEWRGLRFEVVDMDRRRIDKMLVQPARERGAF
jgi:magnesium and cobalt exporter, CNNM family